MTKEIVPNCFFLEILVIERTQMILILAGQEKAGLAFFQGHSDLIIQLGEDLDPRHGVEWECDPMSADHTGSHFQDHLYVAYRGGVGGRLPA